MKKSHKISIGIGLVLILSALLVAGLYFLRIQDPEPETLPAPEDPNAVVDGVHVRTGLVEGEGMMTVVQHCTACHSAQIIIQNRMDREGWKSTIRWMQETQNLWDLGDNEDIIINYLTTHYPPQKKGRRAPLTDIDWYTLKE